MQPIKPRFLDKDKQPNIEPKTEKNYKLKTNDNTLQFEN